MEEGRVYVRDFVLLYYKDGVFALEKACSLEKEILLKRTI